MGRKLLPASIGTYRLIRPTELTEEQKAVLRHASRARVEERLLVLLYDGRALASQVQELYGALMREVGHA